MLSRMDAELVLRAPRRDTDAGAIFELTARAFPHHPHDDWVKWCREAYFDEAVYDWSASRIGFDGDTLATHFGIWRLRMRVGDTEVPVAGVGAVATATGLRGRGLMDLTARACLADLPAAGFAFSLLFGISGFYERFGFTPAWPRSWVTFHPLPPAPPPPGFAEAPPEEGPADAALANRLRRGLTGTAVRPTFTRYRFGPVRRHRWGARRPAGFIVTSTRGTVLQVRDYAGEPSAVLAALDRVAADAALESIEIPSHHVRSPLAVALRGRASTEHRSYAVSGNAMIRFVSLADGLNALAPELLRRIALHSLPPGSLALRVDRESATLAWGRGRLVVEPGRRPGAPQVSGHGIAAMAWGGYSVAELASAGRISAAGPALQLASLLFPPLDPALPEWDGF